VKAWFGVCFKKPIDKQEIAAFNLMTASAKNEDDMGLISPARSS